MIHLVINALLFKIIIHNKLKHQMILILYKIY